MNENQLNHLVDETAELMRLFQNQCQSLSSRLDEKISGHLAEVRGEMVKTVRTDVKNSLQKTIRDYEESLHQSRQQIIEHTKEFNHYLREVSTKNRQLARFSWIIAAVSLGLLLLCGIALSFYYKSILQDLKPQAEMVKLINESDITRCGDRLCAATEKTKQGRYSIVKKRSL